MVEQEGQGEKSALMDVGDNQGDDDGKGTQDDEDMLDSEAKRSKTKDDVGEKGADESQLSQSTEDGCKKINNVLEAEVIMQENEVCHRKMFNVLLDGLWRNSYRRINPM